MSDNDSMPELFDPPVTDLEASSQPLSTASPPPTEAARTVTAAYTYLPSDRTAPSDRGGAFWGCETGNPRRDIMALRSNLRSAHSRFTLLLNDRLISTGTPVDAVNSNRVRLAIDSLLKKSRAFMSIAKSSHAEHPLDPIKACETRARLAREMTRDTWGIGSVIEQMKVSALLGNIGFSMSGPFTEAEALERGMDPSFVVTAEQGEDENQRRQESDLQPGIISLARFAGGDASEDENETDSETGSDEQVFIVPVGVFRLDESPDLEDACETLKMSMAELLAAVTFYSTQDQQYIGDGEQARGALEVPSSTVPVIDDLD